jgi:hypothetical protein
MITFMCKYIEKCLEASTQSQRQWLSLGRVVDREAYREIILYTLMMYEFF